MLLRNSGMKFLCEISSSQAKANAGYSLGFNLMNRSPRVKRTWKCVFWLKNCALLISVKMLIRMR